jgi:hypothetical protein
MEKASTAIETDSANESQTMDNSAQIRPNGMTDEQMRYALAAAGRRKNDLDYLKRGEEGIAEYRKVIQAEADRELAKMENK